LETPQAINDAVIVGAGPAGLIAAIYLARFRRRCLVIEDGLSRARWIPTSHNIPGFIAGIGGTEFLAKLKAQALQFGARIQQAHVSSLSDHDGIFRIETTAGTLCSRFVLLATGVRDHVPDIVGASDAIARGMLRVCPICDAFEAVDKRIAVIGEGPLGEREAEFLSHYSSQVTLLDVGTAEIPKRAPGISRGFERIRIGLRDLRIQRDRVTLSSAGGNRDFDVLYLALGCSPQHELARSIGAACDEHGALTVNAHQETSVRRFYAAGDVLRGLNQVVVAGAESAIAATDIHNKLRALNPLK